ncbi:hypothetical protein CPB85DRAFT_1254373 [Mucidula mucida]|nr:hypothetical protein CPB85DRAFT_1254373 [Mucidula mucida]
MASSDTMDCWLSVSPTIRVLPNLIASVVWLSVLSVMTHQQQMPLSIFVRAKPENYEASSSAQVSPAKKQLILPGIHFKNPRTSASQPTKDNPCPLYCRRESKSFSKCNNSTVSECVVFRLPGGQKQGMKTWENLRSSSFYESADMGQLAKLAYEYSTA